MADTEDLRDAVSSRSFGAAAIDPEAQAVVTDFLDYTEYLPSDLTRSYTLIRVLDETYEKHVAEVHRLTTVYGKLPSMPSAERPDATMMRRDISIELDKALSARAAACAEARRINDVVKRHMARLQTIKMKLKALPKPPSRDPTPVPQEARPSPTKVKKEAERLKLLKRKGGGTKIIIPAGFLPAMDAETEEDEEYGDRDEEDMVSQRKKKSSPSRRRHTMDADVFKKTPKSHRMALLPKTSRPPKVRPPGAMGTNVHSAVAGISTSNALKLLTPPPENAPAGSKWRPWFKLTEYEMAKLRKSMKKNAVWTPSEAMVRRELHKDSRGREYYDRAKATADAKGEVLLDEESIDDIKNGGGLEAGRVSRKADAAMEQKMINQGMRLNEAKRLKKEKATVLTRRDSVADSDNSIEAAETTPAAPASGGKRKSPDKDPSSSKRSRTRGQAKDKVMHMDDLNSKLAAMGQQMKNLFDGSTMLSTPSLTRSSRKRKRAEPTSARATAVPGSSEPSPRQAPPKKAKIESMDGRLETPNKSPVLMELDQPESSAVIKTSTTAVPLAAEGPTSPLSPVDLVVPSSDLKKRAGTPTAATSRPRRVSAAPLNMVNLPLTPSLEANTLHNTRRSKAASAEPPARRRELRDRKDLRRLSVNADTAPPTPTASIAPSGRPGRSGGRRPPGLVIAEDKNSKGRVSLGRRKAKPTKAQKAGAQKKEETEEESSDEERYCVCGGVSWGTMVACDNQDVSLLFHDLSDANRTQCEKEWFHISCVGLKKAPDKETKWYCPDCTERGVPNKGRTARRK
jgi:hypothetical protein